MMSVEKQPGWISTGSVCVYVLGYLHQRADKRNGNPPQGNQEPLIVTEKVGRTAGKLWVSKSMKCDIFPFSALWCCLLGDRKGIRPVKSWVLVCSWWRFDHSFPHLIAAVVPIISSPLAPIKPANPGSPGKWPLKWRVCVCVHELHCIWSNNTSLEFVWLTGWQRDFSDTRSTHRRSSQTSSALTLSLTSRHITTNSISVKTVSCSTLLYF